MVKTEASDTVHHLEGRRQSGHQRPKRRSRNSEIIGIGAWSRLQEILGRRVSRDDRIMKPSENRVECHGKQKAFCGAALSDSSGHEEVSSRFPCELNLRHIIALNHAQEWTRRQVISPGHDCHLQSKNWD